MKDGGLRLTEEQVWILRRVIEAAVQLLTNEEDIKKCVSLFEKWEAGTLCLIHHRVVKRQKTKPIGSWWCKQVLELNSTNSVLVRCGI